MCARGERVKSSRMGKMENRQHGEECWVRWAGSLCEAEEDGSSRKRGQEQEHVISTTSTSTTATTTTSRRGEHAVLKHPGWQRCLADSHVGCAEVDRPETLMDSTSRHHRHHSLSRQLSVFRSAFTCQGQSFGP
ncbi:uncharacterized protein SEPMUDRAFT_151704 [Sphaerulina musiva SO2202]|uniref:Uncharacterized protein n=1 Tax=Sphaerulina musiva (strain SO2202) TaxID=692275 RepID=M3CXC9_SPHMS|nr:uncharacterized protein SEPMUDRAFT_151704 [Sphaerulina musiva SO2202]EMF08762.1 hypothetical protein SEPMUDRAFT_151704 [Sphaerulina musiva SO2202]